MIERLHKKFKPGNYQIKIDVDHQGLTFAGSVQITGKKIVTDSSVTLHAKDLVVTSAEINGVAAKVSHHDFDVLKLSLDEEIKSGECQLTMDFEGKITDDMSGMYPCYFDHDGKKKWLVATQFESHYAREVFPCVDEPEAKATFDLSVTTEAGQTVLSNMPAKTQDKHGGKITTTFETTPKMSTYLLAFVAGEMHSLETKTKDDVLVRSWSSVAQPLENLQFSVNEAARIIEFYDDYFETPYPLAKCDQVALPDFDAGAMENWGLVTYRETALLSDPKNSSISSTQYISIVIAHELSHQWFGNLVTMKWWDDLWLNESFASLMEYIAVDHIHPEWQIWEQYTASDAIIASNRDVYSDVQPVRVDVEDPAEISSLFDGAIVYAKGGRLLKMLRELIGDDDFRSGLKLYFDKHAYGNTTRDDLWEVMTKSSGLDISSMMNSWLEQSGMPLITLLQDGEKLFATQERLLLDREKPSNQLWQVPLLANKQLNPELLGVKQRSFKSADKEMVILNQFGSGHFVTKYESDEQKKQLRASLAQGRIPTEGRIILLNDEILLARAGKSSLVDSLDLLPELKDEPRDNVWSLMSSIIGNSRMLVEGNGEAEDGLRKLSYDLAENWHSKLGWDFISEEDANTTQLRRSILGLIVSSEYDHAVEEALQQYKKDAPENLPAEVRSLLMSAAVRFGKQDDRDKLITLLRETQSAELQLDTSSALCSTKDASFAKELTALLKDKNVVRPQDLIRWYAYLLRNKHTRETMWQWTVENWDWLLDVFKASKSYDYLPRYAANFMNSQKWLDEYREFFSPMAKDPALTRTIKVGIKEIEARVAWRSRDENKVVDWLVDKGY